MPDTATPSAYVSDMAEEDGAIHQIENPITRSTVSIEPPFAPPSPEHEMEFLRRLHAYCVAAWDLGRMDPMTVRLAGLDLALDEIGRPTSSWCSWPGAYASSQS